MSARRDAAVAEMLALMREGVELPGELLDALGAPDWMSQAHGIAARTKPPASGEVWGSALPFAQGERQELIRVSFDRPRPLSLSYDAVSAPALGAVGGPQFRWFVTTGFGPGVSQRAYTDLPRIVEGQSVQVVAERVDANVIAPLPVVSAWAISTEQARPTKTLYEYDNVLLPAPAGVVAAPVPPSYATHVVITPATLALAVGSNFLWGQTFKGITWWARADEGITEGATILRGATAYFVGMLAAPAVDTPALVKFLR